MPHVIFLLCREKRVQPKWKLHSCNLRVMSGNEGSLFGKQDRYKFWLCVSAHCSVMTVLQAPARKKDGSLWTGFPPAYWEMLLGNFSQLSHIIFCFVCLSLADFGVSAKNTKTLQRRDSFIGTPYWWVRHHSTSEHHQGTELCLSSGVDDLFGLKLQISLNHLQIKKKNEMGVSVLLNIAIQDISSHWSCKSNIKQSCSLNWNIVCNILIQPELFKRIFTLV